MNRERLLALTFRVGMPLVLLLTAGDVIMMPRAAGGQPQREGLPLPGEVAPVRGAHPREVRMRGEVPCAEVISTVNRQVSEKRGRSVNVVVIARGLGSTKAWVAHCMRAYGRHVPASLDNAEDEDALEKFEEQEPEESAAEDVPEPGAKERDVEADENSHDQHELHADHPKGPMHEKERRVRPHPEPSNKDTDFEDQ